MSVPWLRGPEVNVRFPAVSEAEGPSSALEAGGGPQQGLHCFTGEGGQLKSPGDRS